MSLPPGFLEELRSRTSIAQVAGRKLVWDARKSNQGKGDLWAPCPFHQEKTASFHVDDRKGFYYCFGCHAKGDAISFVRETENVSFIEAVEILAGEAGMQMPARDPKAAEKADRRSELVEVVEQAVQYFRLQLSTTAGAEARAYLEKRGLSAEAQARWELGFAPQGWQNLWDHLRGKGIAEEKLMATGLAKPSSKEGGKPYDVFRNRIMFPIRDARGRAIAFGGRAMDPGDPAKYLNSPETELFDKSRVLFNVARAREAAGKGQRLVVAEGYMDVIALSEAGFGAAVAPLGTAVTEPQLQMIWRIAEEPVFAMDGDRAGVQAAMRVMDLALPLLEAGKAIRFSLLPDKQDPDDVISAGGPEAMEAQLAAAKPMVRLLWQRATEGKVFDSPERRAALDKDLRGSISAIRDPSIKRHYGEEVRHLREDLFGYSQKRSAPGKSGASGYAGGRRGSGARLAALPTASARASDLAKAESTEAWLREALVLAVLARHPAMIAEYEDHLLEHSFQDAELGRLAAALLSAPDGDPELQGHLEAKGCSGSLERLVSHAHLRIAPALRFDAPADLVHQTVSETFAKLSAQRGCDREISEALDEFASREDEGLTWRLAQAAEARNQAERSFQEDKTEYEVADNGARLSRDERGALDQLLKGITFSKGESRGG
ncbi:MAG: DNA primase [Dinoroseobacter sp.]|nr:DNA primase [Dinoroseobacter sp.]